MLDNNFRQFIKEQIALPEKKWNSVFVDYIQKKHQELHREVENFSSEQKLEKEFQRYLECLDISKDDLIGKRILDLGCGEGDFIKHCLGQGISKEAYGLDILIEPEEINSGYRQFFLKHDFEKAIPLKDFDYIFSVSAIDAPYSKEIDGNLRETIILALVALKHEGEIRIFSVRKAPPSSGLTGIDFSRKKWIELLDDLKTKNWINYELRPIDIRVAGNKPDVWLEEVLIIRKELVKIDF
ncbi:class I SAM-dependent methyltransferase [Patescibacteria group bacterium]|nr:class I SAM-dependent methyltransferase [Patescibacteria group bacterium]MBU4162177.1 class I SAM-dependent methyltransferase [Patescibacteria group bacterium]